jgi:glycyl-tRNA synthetase
MTLGKTLESNPVMEKLVSLCKRRGYIFQSSEIYGGLNSCYDYGPLGIELKNNIKSAWWRAMTYHHDNIEGVDASILMHARVWEASGHVEGFTDPLVDCKECKQRFRADKTEGNTCPDCGGQLTDPRQFNLMFKTFMGPVEEDAAVIFLRPETAQGIFVNFLNVQTASRQKVPFGIAQIGKAFRNEITPSNFIFRTREFEQMEMQFFVHPSEDAEWFERWREERFEWHKSIGITPEKLRWNEHGPDELAHYAKTAYDIEFEFPFGWQEIEGVHNRTDFDLRRHQEFSGKKLEYFDEARKEKFIPYVIETSVGCDRTLLTTLVDAYDEEDTGKEIRTVLRLSPKVAPLKAAILPLVKRDGMPEFAKKVTDELMRAHRVFYDETAAIGRRYRRQDEIGTPYCFTIDSQTLEDQTVTVRDRDSMEQERIAANALRQWLDDRVLYT